MVYVCATAHSLLSVRTLGSQKTRCVGYKRKLNDSNSLLRQIQWARQIAVWKRKERDVSHLIDLEPSPDQSEFSPKIVSAEKKGGARISRRAG